VSAADHARLAAFKDKRTILTDEAPPPGPVPWLCTSQKKPEANATVQAQLWATARTLGAALLGVPPEEIEAVRLR
jgi:hypothetical protein